jgi:hypothetical protein
MQNQQIKSLNKPVTGKTISNPYWMLASSAGTALAAMSSSSLANLGSSISSSASKIISQKSSPAVLQDVSSAFTGAAGSLTKSITDLAIESKSSKGTSSLTIRKCVMLYMGLLKKGYKNAIIACKQFICNCYNACQRYYHA